MAIVYNLGSNILLGEVSYITKALAAVLQLGVTLDYSIFLWHSYKEMKEIYPDDHKEAMAVAIGNTLTSVVGSSITTVAGFIALCFMSFTLGLDLGIVMAKGVVFGVIGCVTILPSLIPVSYTHLATRRFAFEAFLPADKNERKDILKELEDETRTMIIYEAPHRLLKTLKELSEVLGGSRAVTICKELTKRYENSMVTTLAEACSYYENNQPRGE